MSSYVAAMKCCTDEKKNQRWKHHYQSCIAQFNDIVSVVMYGDSNITNYKHWSNKFGVPVANFAYGGDRIEQCKYMVQKDCRPPATANIAILQIGSNNISDVKEKVKDGCENIANGIIEICDSIKAIRPDIHIIVTAMFPGVGRPLKTISNINRLLSEKLCYLTNITFQKPPGMKPDDGKWLIRGSRNQPLPNPLMFKDDGIHFSDLGYNHFITYIQDMCENDAAMPYILKPFQRDFTKPDPWSNLSICKAELVSDDDQVCGLSKLNTGCTHTGTSLQQQLDDRLRHCDAHYRKKFFSQK